MFPTISIVPPPPGQQFPVPKVMMLLRPAGVRSAMDHPLQGAFRAQGGHVVMAQDQGGQREGGGDTGPDCMGTAVRQGALSVTQLGIIPKPPERENKLLTWPHWPMKLRTSTSPEEGCVRGWAVGTQAFLGENGWVTGVQTARLEWRQDAGGRWVMTPVPGSEFVIKAELVLLATGFVHPVHEGMISDLGVALVAQSNVRANIENYQTSIDKVFTAGDMRRGWSLVVWAIREGASASGRWMIICWGGRIWRGRGTE